MDTPNWFIIVMVLLVVIFFVVLIGSVAIGRTTVEFALLLILLLIGLIIPMVSLWYKARSMAIYLLLFVALIGAMTILRLSYCNYRDSEEGSGAFDRQIITVAIITALAIVIGLVSLYLLDDLNENVFTHAALCKKLGRSCKQSCKQSCSEGVDEVLNDYHQWLCDFYQEVNGTPLPKKYQL
jgi:hypothetical protein